MKFKISFFAILLALSLLLHPSPLLFAAFLAAVLHELGHMAAAALCHIPLRTCKIGLYGAGLVPDGNQYSYQKELCLCLTGPLTNLVFALLTWLFFQEEGSSFIDSFLFSSLVLGIMNLLPFPALDGGHLLLYVIEAIRRKPMKKELEGIINFLGLIILLALAVIISIKDIIAL